MHGRRLHRLATAPALTAVRRSRHWSISRRTSSGRALIMSPPPSLSPSLQFITRLRPSSLMSKHGGSLSMNARLLGLVATEIAPRRRRYISTAVAPSIYAVVCASAQDVSDPNSSRVLASDAYLALGPSVRSSSNHFLLLYRNRAAQVRYQNLVWY